MVSDKLNKIIYKKLYNDLSHVEIIPVDKHIWFIDRDNKYWYFRYNKNTGELLWRYDFFYRFFSLFSMDSSVFTSVISSWVEEVLNYRVNTTTASLPLTPMLVEEVLNYRVNTTNSMECKYNLWVEEVLNYRVNTTPISHLPFPCGVEEVLNYRLNTTTCYLSPYNPEGE